MTTEIKVPVLPESVADATVATWHKNPGDLVEQDENLVDIETDKVVLEVVAPVSGKLGEIIKNTGETVLAEEVIGSIVAADLANKSAGSTQTNATQQNINTNANSNNVSASSSDALSPAVRRLLDEHNLDAKNITGSGKDGRITKEDVEKFIANKNTSSVNTSKNTEQINIGNVGSRFEERVPMTRLRAKIAERLVAAQHNAAMLTTFNEVNMKPAMDLRSKYKDQFEKIYGVRMGFMSFFTVAVIAALKKFPAVNASIDGNDIVYHGYYDIGVAVSSPRGLVVPVLRNAENMTMAEIEKSIRSYGEKAKDGKLTLEEMTGGTFTISNGGVFGSLMSAPILNPPQSGILGMAKIQERPIAENGQVVIRPMMYISLSYDHRIVDGRESVSFLVAIKEILEEPSRLVIGV